MTRNRPPLGLRMLAHSIDACTAAVPARRRYRRNHPSIGLAAYLILVALAVSYFGARMLHAVLAHH